MQAWAATDTNFTGSGANLTGSLDHWNFYLTYIWPTPPQTITGVWPPNLAEVFPSATDTTQMTATQYWAGMQPYLAQMGLSGIMAGLGCGCDGGGGNGLLWLLVGVAAAFGAVSIWGQRA
jgi:hypothetical protein